VRLRATRARSRSPRAGRAWTGQRTPGRSRDARGVAGTLCHPGPVGAATSGRRRGPVALRGRAEGRRVRSSRRRGRGPQSTACRRRASATAASAACSQWCAHCRRRPSGLRTP
jgi:hypothetical protein